LFCTHENRGETPPAVADKRDGPAAVDVVVTASRRV
jgi:hypothetical protein